MNKSDKLAILDKSLFRRLLEMSDKAARKEIGDYYIVDSGRMDNLLICLERGAEEIRKLNKLLKQIEQTTAQNCAEIARYYNSFNQNEDETKEAIAKEILLHFGLLEE